MTAVIFVPIADMAPGPDGGLIVCGTAARAEAGLLGQAAGAALAEMSGVEPVGRIADAYATVRGWLVRALVTGRLAAEKVREGVYKGLALVIDGAGEVVQAALVDHPQALGKRGGGRAPPPLPLLPFGNGFTRRSGAPPAGLGPAEAPRRPISSSQEGSMTRYEINRMLEAVQRGDFAGALTVAGGGSQPVQKAAASIVAELRGRQELFDRLPYEVAKGAIDRADEEDRLAEPHRAHDFGKAGDRNLAIEMIAAARRDPRNLIRPSFAFGISPR